MKTKDLLILFLNLIYINIYMKMKTKDLFILFLNVIYINIYI